MSSKGLRRVGSVFIVVLVATLLVTPACFAQGGLFLGDQTQQVTQTEEEPGVVTTVFGFLQSLFGFGPQVDAASSDDTTFDGGLDSPETTTITNGGGDGDDDLIDIGPGLDPQN